MGFFPVAFIPASAGNTLHNPPQDKGSPVYPRWRGEHLPLIEPESIDAGLSPLARGTLFLLVTAFTL